MSQKLQGTTRLSITSFQALLVAAILGRKLLDTVLEPRRHRRADGLGDLLSDVVVVSGSLLDEPACLLTKDFVGLAGKVKVVPDATLAVPV